MDGRFFALHVCARCLLSPAVPPRRDKSNMEDLIACDIDIAWAIKGSSFIFSRRKLPLFPHFLLLEEPWFWRSDPIDPNRTWGFMAWDFLNG